MTHTKALAWLAISMLIVVGSGTSAVAQTACPVGTPAGSATCGPSPGSGGQIAPPPSRPSGEWLKTWGAIATSSSGGGVSSRQLSKRDAEEVAIRNCKTSGGSNCTVEFSYENTCVALVYPPPPEKIGQVATAANVDDAKARALMRCNDRNLGQCKVAVAECSESVFRKY